MKRALYARIRHADPEVGWKAAAPLWIGVLCLLVAVVFGGLGAASFLDDDDPLMVSANAVLVFLLLIALTGWRAVIVPTDGVLTVSENFVRGVANLAACFKCIELVPRASPQLKKWLREINQSAIGEHASPS